MIYKCKTIMLCSYIFYCTFQLFMELKLTTYNLHGFNQGKTFLPSVCSVSDIVLIQEHWLYDDELHLLGSIHDDFVCVCTSAMTV